MVPEYSKYLDGIANNSSSSKYWSLKRVVEMIDDDAIPRTNYLDTKRGKINFGYIEKKYIESGITEVVGNDKEDELEIMESQPEAVSLMNGSD